MANVGLEIDLLEWGAPLWRLVDICWNGEFNWWSNADLNLMCGELWLQTCVSEQNFFLETLRIWSDLVWIYRWLLTFFKTLHLQSTRSTVKIVIFKSRSSKKLFNFAYLLVHVFVKLFWKILSKFRCPLQVKIVAYLTYWSKFLFWHWNFTFILCIKQFSTYLQQWTPNILKLHTFPGFWLTQKNFVVFGQYLYNSKFNTLLWATARIKRLVSGPLIPLQWFGHIDLAFKASSSTFCPPR